MNSVYEPPILTVDSVIFELVGDELAVLLIQRATEPFKGEWALPGGYVAAGETTGEATTRVLGTKAGLRSSDLRVIEQLYTFDTVARDPRGHAVSVTYMGLGKSLGWQANKTRQNPRFFPVSQLPALAYDHTHIIQYAHQRLGSKITYTNVVFALLPELFTLAQLQAAYEAILGRQLDNRNFRKRFLSLQVIKPSGQYKKDGAHRPAMLYRFCREDLNSLHESLINKLFLK